MEEDGCHGGAMGAVGPRGSQGTEAQSSGYRLQKPRRQKRGERSLWRAQQEGTQRMEVPADKKGLDRGGDHLDRSQGGDGEQHGKAGPGQGEDSAAPPMAEASQNGKMRTLWFL